MAHDKCDKCEETGLLYDSGELPATQKLAFEKDLSLCPPCDKGYRRYVREKSAYYNEPVLSDQPSAAVDSKIIRSAAVKPVYTPLYLFNLYIKKSVVATLVLAVGLGLGFFAVYQYMGSDTPAVAGGQKTGNAAVASVEPVDSQNVAVQKDTLKTESLEIPFSKRVGNTNVQGIVPVDLNK